MDKLLKKAQGCLIGGAAGDALGYPVEFYDWEQIEYIFGALGVSHYGMNGGIVSDDTQMTLFTAEALLKAQGDPISALTQGYKDWYSTQYKTPPRGTERLTGLLANPELYALRAPGGTCLAAIREGCNGSIESRINDSKGCGGIMRVAPVGIMYKDPAQAALIGAQASALTHGHDYGILPAGVLACIVSVLLNHPEDAISRRVLAERIFEAVVICQEVFVGLPSMNDLAYEILKVVDEALRSKDVPIENIGAGWVAEETLYIAIYCAIKKVTKFKDALMLSVNHSGDSDSTGAVTGNILGAFLGVDYIPEEFKNDLQFKAELLGFGEKLLTKRNNFQKL